MVSDTPSSKSMSCVFHLDIAFDQIETWAACLDAINRQVAKSLDPVYTMRRLFVPHTRLLQLFDLLIAQLYLGCSKAGTKLFR